MQKTIRNINLISEANKLLIQSIKFHFWSPVHKEMVKNVVGKFRKQHHEATIFLENNDENECNHKTYLYNLQYTENILCEIENIVKSEACFKLDEYIGLLDRLMNRNETIQEWIDEYQN